MKIILNFRSKFINRWHPSQKPNLQRKSKTTPTNPAFVWFLAKGLIQWRCDGKNYHHVIINSLPTLQSQPITNDFHSVTKVPSWIYDLQWEWCYSLISSSRLYLHRMIITSVDHPYMIHIAIEWEGSFAIKP